MMTPMQRWVRKGLVVWASLVIVPAVGAFNRVLVVESTPPGATVTAGGKVVGQTPTLPFKLEFKSDGEQWVEVALEGYETQRVRITGQEARAIKKEPHRLPMVELPRILVSVRTMIQSGVEGAEVTVNGRAAGVAPVSTNLVFSRPDGRAPWSSNVVAAARLPRYAPDVRVVTLEAAERGASGGAFNLELSPGEVQREVVVEIKANEPRTDVKVDGVKVGVTPLRHTFLFKRATASDPWRPMELRLEKEGFEYSPANDQMPQPAFTVSVTADCKSNVIETLNLKPQGFVASPVHFFEDRGRQVRVISSNILSQVRRDQRDDAPSPVSKHSTNRPLVVSRLSPVPGEPGNVVCSLPVWDERTGSDALNMSERVVGANIVKLTPTGPSPVTVGKFFDLDPFVTREWVYFSSVRTDRRIIWRVPVSGRGGLAPVTGIYTKWDTEPAVSPDEAKLAYVSREPDAPGGGEPYIWISDADGKLPQQRWPGRNPAWSPDNRRLAYVTPDNRLAVVEVDSNNPVFLTDGDCNVHWPVWLSRDELLYSTDQAKNERGERNFDLWIRNLQSASAVQRTFDGSFDSWATAGDEGREVFFFSNRGANRPFQERLQIYRMELKPAAVAEPVAAGAPGSN
jgi:hypothetical protein